MKKFLAFLFLSVVLISTGCKKDDKVCDLNAANITGDYIFTSIKLNGVEILNDPDYFEPCERDDLYTLLPNGTYTITDGQTTCPGGTSFDDGTWTISGNTFSLDGEGGAISDFSCSGFTWTLQEFGFTTVFRFTKQ